MNICRFLGFMQSAISCYGPIRIRLRLELYCPEAGPAELLA